MKPRKVSRWRLYTEETNHLSHECIPTKESTTETFTQKNNLIAGHRVRACGFRILIYVAYGDDIHEEKEKIILSLSILGHPTHRIDLLASHPISPPLFKNLATLWSKMVPHSLSVSLNNFLLTLNILYDILR